MKLIDHCKKLIYAGTISLFFLFTFSAVQAQREYYELTVYHFTNETQEKLLDSYLQNAYLPALHRLGAKNIGVFKAHANDTSAVKKLYVLLPVVSLDMLKNIPEKIQQDKIYLAAGSEYINATFDKPPYSRIEKTILEAFSLAPVLKTPGLSGPRRERIYELRSYESATEKIFKNKVHMFNEGDEIGLFSRLKFNAVFYGEVIAGSKMPNLIYMTCN